ncbi:MAG: DUF4340 domain-containing protein [Burkholderiaceae bacterium]|nr:MAG: DUF4340 domain-containing protein [Burkholderiaceae bacterium]
MMIGKYNRILWPLLFAQIVITGIVYFYTGLLQGPEVPRMLLTLDSRSVETLRIIGPGEKSVLLEKAKKSGEWGLPEFDGFPANSQAVVQLIDRLTNTELGMQVSKQADSFDRMKVADNNFERKVEIGKASEIKTIFFGSAPALRQAHARLSGEKIVYAVKFAPGDIDLKASDWIKKDLLVVDEKKVQTVMSGNIKIQRTENVDVDGQEGSKPAWKLFVNNKPAESQDNEKVDEFVKEIADMQIDSIGLDADIGNVSKKNTFLISLELEGGKKIEYRFAKLNGEEDYLMTTSSRPESFRLPPLASQKLLELSRPNSLIKKAD